jgi:transcriptional regulator with XRE-family HTH domain
MLRAPPGRGRPAADSCWWGYWQGPSGRAGRAYPGGMDNRAEIRAFLKSRRDKLTPEQAGLPVYGTRRVSGLRRSEVAMLSGVSVEYYTRLERGSLGGVSDSVLDSLAGALRLDDTERAHLYDLAQAASASPGRVRRRPARPSAQTRRPRGLWAAGPIAPPRATRAGRRPRRASALSPRHGAAARTSGGGVAAPGALGWCHWRKPRCAGGTRQPMAHVARPAGTMTDLLPWRQEPRMNNAARRCPVVPGPAGQLVTHEQEEHSCWSQGLNAAFASELRRLRQQRRTADSDKRTGMTAV